MLTECDMHKLQTDSWLQMSLNYCSLRSLRKRAALKAMVDEHLQASYYLGCGTHLDETSICEAFSQGYSIIIIKDQCIHNRGGGVFLAISQSIQFLDLSIATNAETIWAKTTLIHGESIAIGSC